MLSVDLMIEIFQGILLSSIFVSTTTALVLLWRSFRDQINPSNRVFAAYLLIMAVYGVVSYIFEFYRTPYAIAISFGHFAPLYYLAGPAIWIYVRNTVNDLHQYKKSDFIHLIPFLIHLISLSAYLFSPFSEKLTMAYSILGDSENILYNNVSTLFPTKWNYFLRPGLALVYAFGALGYVVRQHFEKPVKSIRWLSLQNWFYVFLGTNILVYSTYLGLFVANQFLNDLTFREVQDQTFFFQASGILFVMLSILPLIFPHILYGNIKLSFTDSSQSNSFANTKNANPALVTATESEEDVSVEKQSTTGIGNSSPRKQLQLSSSTLEQLDFEINRVIKQSEPHLYPDFSVRQLAELVRVPTYHLNYYFTEYKGIRFGDYRTQLRIRHAVDLIASGEANQLTIEGIATVSGYRNRSTFINHFKQETGLAPSNYIQKKLSIYN